MEIGNNCGMLCKIEGLGENVSTISSVNYSSCTSALHNETNMFFNYEIVTLESNHK